jgi:hypothetical protein
MGVFREVDLALLDPADRDDRLMLIEAEHPEFADALQREDELVILDGEEVSPLIPAASMTRPRARLEPAQDFNRTGERDGRPRVFRSP